MDNKVHQLIFCYQLFFFFFKEMITESALVDASVQTSVRIYECLLPPCQKMCMSGNKLLKIRNSKHYQNEENKNVRKKF